MNETARMQIPFPEENNTSWFSVFASGTMALLDTALYALREDRNLFLFGGGTMTFNQVTATLTWTSPLQLVSFQTGVGMSIPAGSLELPDGGMGYVVLVRGLENSQSVSMVARSAPVGSGDADNGLVMCVRQADRIYFRNGQVLRDGESFPVIENGGRIS